MKRPSAKVRRLGAVGLGLLAAAGLMASVAGAQESGGGQVRRVDARTGEVAIDVFLPEGASSLSIVEEGEERPVTSVVPLAEAGVVQRVVVVFDNSETLGNGPFQKAKAALAAVTELGGTTEIGLVATGGRARTAVRIGDDMSGTADVAMSGVPHLWDGLVEATDALDRAERDDGPANSTVVIVSGSADLGSTETFGAVRARLDAIDATVMVLALEGSTADVVALQQLVDERGGALITTSADGIAAALTDVDEFLSSQYRVTYSSDLESEELIDVTLTAGGESVALSYPDEVLTTGAASLALFEGSPGGAFDFLESSAVKYLLILLLIAATGTVAFSLLSLVVKRADNIDSMLSAYGVDPDAIGPDTGMMSRVALVRRAVKMTGDLAESRGLLERAEAALERANLPLRAAEAMFVYGCAIVLLSLASLVFTRSLITVLVVAGSLTLLPPAVINYLARRRQKKFLAQLPDTLQLLAGTMRAGYSIMQGFEAVASEVQDPMGAELGRVITEARLGRPLEEALDSAAQRMDSDDFAWAVMAIRIQREVGGNLAELLLTVGDTMTQRERLRRDVSGLTAEGRVSAMVLGALPLGLGAFMYMANPDYIGVLFEETMGLILLGVAGVAMLAGFLWMKKIIKIDV